MNLGGRPRIGDAPSRKKYSCKVCSLPFRSDALKRHYDTFVERDPDSGKPTTPDTKIFTKLNKKQILSMMPE